MNLSTALRRLNSVLGKSCGYRIDKGAPTPEARADARRQMPDAVAERDKLGAAREARRQALLDADEEYQTLKLAHEAAKKKVHGLSATTHRHRITVGKSNSLFFSVMAEADTWEEVFEKLAAKGYK